MDSTRLQAVAMAAFDLLGAEPANLELALQGTSALKSPDEVLTVDVLFNALTGANSNDALRIFVHRRFIDWDYATEPTWGDGSRANTLARRARVYELLNLR